MMSPDHICARPICPAGRSLYIVMVTFGEVAATSACSCSPTIFRSASDEVLTSVMPCFSSTMAIAVWKSSMTAVLPLYCGSHNDSYGLANAPISAGTWSVRQPIPVV